MAQLVSTVITGPSGILLHPTDLVPVLQSPDGNWMALKDDGTRPPTRLLAKPKSGTFQALEEASSVTSAYDEIGSDSEEDFDYSEALSKLCPASQGRSKQLQPQPAQAQSSGQRPLATSPSNPEAMCSDSETSSTSSSREAGCRARLSWLQRKPPSRSPTAEKVHLQGKLDVNFNPQAASGETSDSSEQEEALPTADHRARRWRRGRVGPEEPNRELPSPGTPPKAPHTSQVKKVHLQTHTHFESRVTLLHIRCLGGAGFGGAGFGLFCLRFYWLLLPSSRVTRAMSRQTLGGSVSLH